MQQFIENIALVLHVTHFEITPVCQMMAMFVSENPSVSFDQIERTLRRYNIRLFLFAEKPDVAKFNRNAIPLAGKTYLLSVSTKPYRYLAMNDFEDGTHDEAQNLIRLKDAHFASTGPNFLENLFTKDVGGGKAVLPTLQLFKDGLALLINSPMIFKKWKQTKGVPVVTFGEMSIDPLEDDLVDLQEKLSFLNK